MRNEERQLDFNLATLIFVDENVQETAGRRPDRARCAREEGANFPGGRLEMNYSN